jgi:hypothetical protein
MDNFKEKIMKNSFPFLLLPLIFLFSCETPIPPNRMDAYSRYYITESFDFVNSDFNQATFNAQRSAWQEWDYKNYSYVLYLSGKDASENLEDPWEVYKCKVVVEEGKDPELTWIEGVPPEGRPSVYTIDGIYNYVFSLIENLERRVKEGNEEFRGSIRYDTLDNIPLFLLIDRLENGIWEGFRNMYIGGISPVVEEEVPEKVLDAFDRGTFEQEYNAWKELDIRNYRYSLYIKDSRLDESGGAAAWDIVIRNGKVTQATNTSGQKPPLEDYTIDGVFDFISSAIEDPSSSGLEFQLAYSPKYHRPLVVTASTDAITGGVFTPEKLQYKIIIHLNSFAILP